MDLVAIRSALGSWFGQVTGLVPRDREGAQHWGGTFNPVYTAAPVNAYGLLHLAVVGTVGVDRTHYEYDDQEPQGSEIIPHMQGARVVRWEVQIESLSQRAGEDAAYFLGRVRDLLRAPSAITAFKAVELGVQDISETQDLTRLLNQRRVSLGQVDILFNAGTDVTDTAFGYVERFDVSTEWRDSEGNLLPAELQFQGEIPQ